MDSPIYMYYQLDNFYQNHRRYVKSRSDTQLRDSDLYDVSGSCEPLATRSCGAGTTQAGSCAVYPCGLIAWSVFNDTFYGWEDPAASPPSATAQAALASNAACTDATKCFKITRNNLPVYVPWKKDGIAWKSDKDKKFINPGSPMPYGDHTGACSDSSCLALPYEGYKYIKCTESQYNDTVPMSDLNYVTHCPAAKQYADVANEEFIVWMRTSGLPDFRKLHRIIDTDLKSGDTIDFYVNNVFPVTEFDGKKKIVLSTTTWIGGKNQFLGWAYVVVAILCLLLAIGFGIKQWVSPREPTTSSELETTLTQAPQES